MLAALVFATMSQGGLAVNAVVPKQMVDVLQAVVIIAVAASVPEVRRMSVAARDERPIMIVLAFLAQTLRIAIPYLFAASGGVMSERAGLIGLGLEGYMLGGAFCGAVGELLQRAARGSVCSARWPAACCSRCSTP